jgi:nickel transport protein
MKKVAMAIWLVLVLAAGAGAHYLWVQPHEDGYLVARGLPPAELYAYNPEKIKDIQALDSQGQPLAVSLRREAARLWLQTPQPPAMVTVVAEWGHRVNTPQGKEFLTKPEALAKGLTVEEAFVSIQTAKTLFAPGPAVTKPVGLALEIVPLQDPLTLAPGQALPVQVLFSGQPLANTRVRVGEVAELFTTDAHGKVTVKLAAGGNQMIMASHRVPAPPGQDIDYVQYMTFLSFARP